MVRTLKKGREMSSGQVMLYIRKVQLLRQTYVQTAQHPHIAMPGEGTIVN